MGDIIQWGDGESTSVSDNKFKLDGMEYMIDDTTSPSQVDFTPVGEETYYSKYKSKYLYTQQTIT